MSAPAPTHEYGSWRVLGSTGALGKRSICRCVKCGQTAVLGAEALSTGAYMVCDCRPRNEVPRNAWRRFDRASWKPGR